MSTSDLPPVMLLDLDDTILAYNDGADVCWQQVCARYGPQVSCDGPALQAAIRAYADWHWSDPQRHREGRLDIRKARAHIITEAIRTLGHDRPELGLQMSQEFTDLREELMKPFPQAVETLAVFKDRGVRMALLTNGNAATQRSKIRRWDLEQYFELIVIEGEFGCGKPEPRVYRHALHQLRVSPADTWMVGDNLDWDVAAPQQLGIFGVWNDFLRTGLPQNTTVRPDRIVHHISDLLD